MIVIDSSYAVALVMPDETRPPSVDAVLSAPLCAPAIWTLEMANVLRNNVRRGRLDAAQVQALCVRLDQLDIVIADDVPMNAHRHYVLATLHDLTSYDASYLELALRRSAALATLDTEMAAAARRAGVRVHS